MRLTRNPRVIGSVLFVALLLAVALWPSPVPVDVATVERGELRVTVDEEGETRVRERFVVTAPVAGRVQRIELEPGDPVKQGDTVLATVFPVASTPLDPRSRAEAQAALAAAESALGRAAAEERRAVAMLELAQSDLRRVQALADERIASAQQLDAARTELRSAEEAVAAARFAVAAARHERDVGRARLAGGGGSAGGPPVVLRSPVDGVVLRRYRESEDTVPAGTPLLEVGDPGRLEIVSDLLSTDAASVRPGQPVVIDQWGGPVPLAGRVQRVEPSGFMKISALGVEEQRVNVVVDLESPPEERASLGDGYRVEVRIVTDAAADVVKVPTLALFRSGEAWAVFVVDDGRARLRPVELGRRNALFAEVRSGLQAGERVVLHPGEKVEDGVRVEPR